MEGDRTSIREEQEAGRGKRGGETQSRPGQARGQGPGQEASAQCPLLHLSVHRSSSSLPRSGCQVSLTPPAHLTP